MFKSKAKISFNYDNQTLNSRTAMFDKLIERSEGTACEARRTSPYCLSEASLRANVPSCLLRRASYVLRRGVARGYRGIPPVLLFFCRRFLFQIKGKCRNAGSIRNLIVVRRKVRYKFILCRLRGSGASRSPRHTSYAPIKLCRVRGRMISAPTT